jgi:hypothetical protein
MLNEGLEKGDLKRLVHDELHIDEFKSKLGRDEDVCVVSFKVINKEPAEDLVNFIEKGYDWVIDADVSSGEMDDGDYIVFVECERNRDIPKNIITMMKDLENLTGHKLSSWRLYYYKDKTEHALSVESLDKLVPQTPEEYAKRYGQRDIDKLKTAAGVKVTTRAPKNDQTESLRIAAGIL